jgi:hypothetical protein
MRTWRIACSAAVLAIGLSTAAHADEWNKLTYLTFSGPVNMPGITLPAGTYRFELMDPDTGRRVIRVSDKEGTKNYGIFLSIADQKLEPSDNPVVMFKETPAGMPPAIQAWFYPGDTNGYEFVYPHDQALKIAKGTHQSVLSMSEPKESTTEADRVASMRGAEVGRIDENGKPVSTDEQLKDSSKLHPSNATASSTTASSTPASSTTASSNAASTTAAAQPTTAPKAMATPQPRTAAPTTAAPTTASDQSAAPASAVGTSGSASSRHLPRTASPVPLMALLSGLALAGAVGVRTARKSLV